MLLRHFHGENVIVKIRRSITCLSLIGLIFASLAQADVLDDILENGTLRVGVAEFVPWTIETESGALVGFEIDIAEKLATDMGVKAKFSKFEWEEIIPALQRGDIDLIAAGMAITPARALQVNFSLPIATSGVSIATNTKKTRTMEALEQLNEPGIVITTVAGTLAEDVSKTLFDRAKITVYANTKLAEKALLEGRAHAYLASMPEVRFLALRNTDKVDVPIDEPLLASSEALAIRKGEQEFLNFLNAWVTARQTDKWLVTAHEHWFGTLGWTREIAE